MLVFKSVCKYYEKMYEKRNCAASVNEIFVRSGIFIDHNF